MDRKDKLAISVILLGVGIILGILWGVYLSHNDYRQGQIDSLTGKIKYELRINSDSTVTWHKILGANND